MCKNKNKLSVGLFTLLMLLPNFAVGEEGQAGGTPVQPVQSNPALEPGSYYAPTDFKTLDQLNQTIERQKKLLEAKANTVKLMQLEKQEKDLSAALLQPQILPPPISVNSVQPEKEETREQAPTAAPLFPMPGGDPLIRSVYGVGEKLEAILQIPGGGQIIVRAGDFLPHGYKVVSISHDAVKIGKARETTILAFGAAPSRPSQSGTDSSGMQGSQAQ